MSKVSEFSFFKGFSFIFEDEGKSIEAWFSAISGLEKVYIDGELICSQRNLSVDSTNKFILNDNEYTTNLKVANIFKGPFMCTLNKNGVPYQRQKLSIPKNITSKKSLFKRFLCYLVLAFIFGILKAYWRLPDYATYIFCSVIAVWVFWYYLNSYKGLVAEAVDVQDV